MITKPTTKFGSNAILLLATACMLTCMPRHSIAEESDTDIKLRATLSNWRSVTPDFLQKPENIDLLRKLKAVAADKHQNAARILLIKMNDEDTIRDSLEAHRSSQPQHRKLALVQLSAAANPALIMRLADDLFIDESSDIVLFNDTGVLPVSMGAASIIRETIIASDEFSPPVKNWANHLPKFSSGLRTQVRAWLNKNKATLSRGDYGVVTTD